MTHLVEEVAILVSAVQIQADGYLGLLPKPLHATIKSFVSSASRLRVTEPGTNLAFGAMYYGLGAEIARAEQAGLTREEIPGDGGAGARDLRPVPVRPAGAGLA